MWLSIWPMPCHVTWDKSFSLPGPPRPHLRKRAHTELPRLPGEVVRESELGSQEVARKVENAHDPLRSPRPLAFPEAPRTHLPGSSLLGMSQEGSYDSPV